MTTKETEAAAGSDADLCAGLRHDAARWDLVSGTVSAESTSKLEREAADRIEQLAKNVLALTASMNSIRLSLRDAQRERDELRALIEEHNAGCEAACGANNDYTDKARFCRDSYLSRGRQCIDCPRDWKIESALLAKGKG
jgi:septal ring factor EnvC (AmiA/AmiB activator)